VPPPQAAPVQSLPADQQADLEKAENFKKEANASFKAQNYEEACTKYFSSINAIRLNQGLKTNKLGKECEMACRSNLALCKLNLKEYDHCVD